jgi:hypothetical protein
MSLVRAKNTNYKEKKESICYAHHQSREGEPIHNEYAPSWLS